MSDRIVGGGSEVGAMMVQLIGWTGNFQKVAHFYFLLLKITV